MDKNIKNEQIETCRRLQVSQTNRIIEWQIEVKLELELELALALAHYCVTQPLSDPQ